MSIKTSFFKVENRKITKINDVNYTNLQEVDKFHFFFDDEWEGLDKVIKICVKDNIYEYPLLKDEVIIPPEAYVPGIISIGINGVKDSRVLATGLTTITIGESAYSDELPSNMPTPTQWDLYIAELNNLLRDANTVKEECEELLAEVVRYRDESIANIEIVEELKNQTQAIKEQVDAQKEAIDEDIAEAESHLDTYNANYEQKLADFNENFTEKKQIIDDDVSDFEDDYEEKMSALNTAGTEKVNAVNTAGSTQVGNVNTAGNTQVGNVNSAGATQKTAVETAGATQKAAVESAGATQVGNVNTAGSTKVSEVNSAGSTQVNAINSAGGAQVVAVESAGTQQTSAVNTAGETQVGNVNSAGTTQTNAVNQAGQQKLDEINSNQTVQQVANHESRLRVLEKKDGRAYSIIRKKNDNSSSAWTRADDAVGLVANAKVATTEAVQNDFDNIYPWSDIKDCNVDATGEPTHYIGESGFTRTEEVYVHIPKHWIKREQYDVEEDGVTNTYEKITIYDYAAEGSQEIAAYLVGKYHTAEENGVHVSKTGLVGKSEYTKANFRTKAKAKGTRWSLLDWHWFDLCYLYLVEYADYNSETKLGHGYIYSNDTKSLLAENSTNRVVINSMTGMYVGKTISIGTAKGNYSIARSRQITAINDYSDETLSNKMEVVFDGDPVDVTTASTVWQSPQINGDLDSFANTSGCLVSDMYHSVVYRGIENIFGNLWQHVDGISIKDGLTYVCYDPTQYANDKFTDPYVALGYENAKTNDSYIREVGYDEEHQLIAMPTRVGGSSSTYLCDNYWYGAGNKILYVGGISYTGGSKCGLFASNCNNASSYSHWYYRSSSSYSTSINGGLGVVNPQKIYLTCSIVIFISLLRYNFKQRDLMCAAPCFVLFGFDCTSVVIRTPTVASMVFLLRIATTLLRTRTGTTGARQLIEVIILHIIFLATWQKLSRNWAGLVSN